MSAKFTKCPGTHTQATPLTPNPRKHKHWITDARIGESRQAILIGLIRNALPCTLTPENQGDRYVTTTGPDIVVVAKKYPDGSVRLYRHAAGTTEWIRLDIDPDGNVTESPPTNTRPAEFVDATNDASDTIRFKVTNSANLPEAARAAANVSEAIDFIKDHFARKNPSDSLVVNGKVTTYGAELNHLKNTQFSITDTDPTKDTGGPGSAVHNSAGGNHSVSFFFEAFDGDGSQDYAHPNYTNLQGLVGIILHELGHVSTEGNQFQLSSDRFWRQENRQNDKTDIDVAWTQSDYFRNNESFAHSYSRDLANAIGAEIGQWHPAESFDYRSPQEIFEERMGPDGSNGWDPTPPIYSFKQEQIFMSEVVV